LLLVDIYDMTGLPLTTCAGTHYYVLETVLPHHNYVINSSTIEMINKDWLVSMSNISAH